MKNVTSLLAASTCAILLTACGGGGGDSPKASTPVAATPAPTTPAPTSPTEPVTPPAPAVTPGNGQATVPVATYAAGSQELDFFTKLNEFRARAGLGLLAQNAALDKANQNHLKYILGNPDVNMALVNPKTGMPVFHEEEAARPGFTGVTALDRANFTQYGGAYVGESGAYGMGGGAGTALTNLIATVYHRQGLMMEAPRDIGIAAGDDRYQTTVITFGYKSQPQTVASDFFGTYPANKQTAVPLVSYIETPNPYADITVNEYGTKTSFPVSVSSAASTTLKVTSFTVTEAGQTAPLDVRLLTAENDPHKLLAQNTAFVVGKAPFKAGTTYNVKFVGTVNGASKIVEWSFGT